MANRLLSLSCLFMPATATIKLRNSGLNVTRITKGLCTTSRNNCFRRYGCKNLYIRNANRSAFEQTRSATTVGNPTAEIVGPTWDNSDMYSDLSDSKLEDHLIEVEQLTEELQKLCQSLDVANAATASAEEVVGTLVEVAGLRERCMILLHDAGVFASCEQSTDGRNQQAKQVLGRTRALTASLQQATQPQALMLRLASDEVITEYLKKVPADSFSVSQSRKLGPVTLSLEEENLMTALQLDGHQAWGQLYDSLSSTLKCEIGGEQLGVAAAAGLLTSPDQKIRREAWDSIQSAWRGEEEAAAAVLNSLTGWRLQVNQLRQARAGREVHYLDSALHSNHMTRATLDAMMQAVAEAQPLAHRALKLQAAALGVSALHPSDLMAPPPPLGEPDSSSSGLRLDFASGLEVVANSVAAVGDDLSQFVNSAAQNNWIDGAAGSSRMPGAYCTGFSSLRTPRVYLSSYTGSYQHVSTLAHELGHAYHSWAMRDMPLAQTQYPMNLAETASIFFETVVGDTLLSQCQSPQERAQYGWADASSAAAFLINIPTRFDFECKLYEARAQGKTLSPDDLRSMMSEAWEGRYGDTLTDTDSMFWASKLHFHLTGIQFYNFPYTFGYLFSLGVYAQQEVMGEGFKEGYVNLLRDTGSMTAEEVVQKHLGASIEEVEFWRGSIRIIEAKIDAFEKALKESGVAV